MTSLRKGAIFGCAALAVVLSLAFAVRSRGIATAGDAQQATSVARTATDSVVTLDTTAQRLAGIELQAVAANGHRELAVNGSITFDADRVSIIAPRAEGRLVQLQVDLGQHVAAGETVALVESPEIGQIRGDLERGRASMDVARRNYEREKRLYEQNISPQKEMLDAEVVYRTAEADVRSAQSKLETYGATAGQGGRYGLTSAVTGTVVERNGSPGQMVGPATNVFTVADLRHVWITVDVYEIDFARVRTGAPVVVSAAAFPGETFKGRVRSMGGVVDTTSHTFKVRVVVENPAQRLRPGMYAQVRIQVPADTSDLGKPAVPDVAVQDVNGTSVIFIALPDARRFVARTVILGERTGTGSIIVNRGLRAGDRVVVKGAFQLKAELMKSTFSGEG